MKMNFEKGDKVKFLNDVGGGIVQSIENKIARVLMDDGFEVPVLLAELILVEKRQKEEMPVRQKPVERLENKDKDENFFRKEMSVMQVVNHEEPPESGKNPAFSVFYAIVPVKNDKEKTEKFDLYLINDSEYIIFFHLMQEVDGFFRSLKSGNLEAETKIFVRSFSRMELNEFPKLKFQSLFLRNGLHRAWSPVHKDIYPDPAELFSFEGFVENDFFEDPAFIENIVIDNKQADYESINKESFKALLKEKEDDQPVKHEKREILPDTEEIDLHIHELVDNFAGMSNGEIIEIQLARFTTALEGAIRGNKTKRIVFIHGVGNGKLKFELRKELDKNYARLRYQDASFKEYGYGATMVILKK
jgi:hypothetical protein